MDIKKLCKKIMNSDEIKGIPLVYVFVVMTCVLDAISSGECFYSTEFEE